MTENKRVVRNPEGRIEEALDNPQGKGGPFTKEQQNEKVQRQGDQAVLWDEGY
jgi:hypothetical protein